MRCTHCNNKVVRLDTKTGDVTLRVQGPITITGQQATARCYWCRQSIVIPIRLASPTLVKVDDKGGVDRQGREYSSATYVRR